MAISLPLSFNIFSACIPGPNCIKYIIFSELCERYAFYGLRAILVIYMTDRLKYSDASAISIFAYSSALCYFTPLFGSYISDVKIGPFNTIVIFSLIYALGSAILAFSALAGGSSTGLAVALVLIGFGTGGIKPCVSPFGASQLEDWGDEEKRPIIVTRYFQAFYFSINLGSTLSFLCTPLIRIYVGYAAAFMVPSVLILLATVLFILPRKQYKIPIPTGSVWSSILPILASWTCNWMYNTIFCKQRLVNINKQNQWTRISRNEKYSENVEGDVINDEESEFSEFNENEEAIRLSLALCRILPILSVMPVFWMLYDQQGSVWTLQAKRMDLHGLAPEHIQLLNPILIMILLPIFGGFVYPYFKSIGFEVSQLQRMGCGMLLACLSYVCAAIVSYMITMNHHTKISVAAQIPQITIMTCAEILLSVTGLEFSYGQAPEALKGTIMALWLLCTGIGDLFTGVFYNILGNSMKLNPSEMNFLFAALMFINFIIFLSIARKY